MTENNKILALSPKSVYFDITKLMPPQLLFRFHVPCFILSTVFLHIVLSMFLLSFSSIIYTRMQVLLIKKFILAFPQLNVQAAAAESEDKCLE